jgi:hypothetical protein
VPCGDVHAMPQRLLESPGEAQITTSHDLHPEMLCSPFCACACCHTVVTTPPAAVVWIGGEAVGPHNDWKGTRPAAPHAGTTGNIWQPPKA